MMPQSNRIIQGWKSNRFSISDFISSGGYGTVYKGYDNTSKNFVALKCCNAPLVIKFVYRELSILYHVRSHYLLQLIDAHVVAEGGIISKLWLALQLMDFDLFSVLHKQDLTFTFEANIKITYQILKGLQYLADSAIIHRDLKPSNIGINRDFQIRILDFGQSRERKCEMTKAVQTIYYRAIEVFAEKQYTEAIDMWSAGCIFSELFTKKILFFSKKPFYQVKEIVKITGLPKTDLGINLDSVRSDAAKVNQLRNHISKGITDFVCHVDQRYGNAKGAENVINLICSMLELDPTKRPTPLHAMNFDLYKQHYDLVKNYPHDKKAVPFKCDCENDSDEVLLKKINDVIESLAEE